MTSVAQKTLSGLFSTGISKVALVGVNLVITGVLANLLSPQDFGLVGMVTVFVGLLSMLGSLGFDSAIVQLQDISQPQMSTLFWVRLFVGAVAAIALTIGAYPISSFYREPRLVGITQCLAVIFVTSSLYQTHRSLLRKELRFSAIASITVASVVGSGVLGVAVALLGGGVWSLVIQSASLDAISAALYWRASTWRPNRVFVFKESVPVIRFGLTMTGASFALYLQRNIDMLLIGRILGATPLGYYALAYRIMYSPVRQISYVFTDVLFPSFSQLQNDPDAIRRAYVRSQKWIALVTLPGMTFVSLQANDIILAFFGKAWEPAGTLLRLLAPAGAIQSLAQVGYVIYPVMNRPDLAAKLGLFNCVAIALAVWVGTHWGVAGAAWGILCATTANWCITEIYAGRLLNLRWADLFKPFASSILACALFFAASVIATTLPHFPALAAQRLLILLPAVAILYTFFLLITERKELSYLKHYLTKSTG
jgi:O-antigen/teichoic acid export membrane protein